MGSVSVGTECFPDHRRQIEQCPLAVTAERRAVHQRDRLRPQGREPSQRAVGVRRVGHVLRQIYITENGCGAADEPATDGTVYDSDRIMFLRSYLTQLQRATADGVPVKGYFHWSTMDNFEWTAGYGTRFGLIHIDYRTLQRTPKLSASFFRELAARHWYHDASATSGRGSYGLGRACG